MIPERYPSLAFREKDSKYRILFVCLGNICRSPAAEGVLLDLVSQYNLGGVIEVDSAGIGAWHTGNLPDHRMRYHASKRGYDLISRARQVRRTDFSQFDRIIAMDDANWDDLRDLCPDVEDLSKIHRMREYFPQDAGYDHVPDPYYSGDDGFNLVLDLLENSCGRLLDDIVNEIIRNDGD